jgi:hypothetical protein
MKAFNIELQKEVKVKHEYVTAVTSEKNTLVTLEASPFVAVTAVTAVTSKNNNSQHQNALEKSFDNPLLVTVYTPNGQALTVLARDDEHKAFLLRMNPKPKSAQIHLIKQG